MELTIRRLASVEDFDACTKLEQEIWGLGDLEAISPITLEALSVWPPAVGLALGAFEGPEMVGLSITLGSLEPGAAYGHMLGVRPDRRDQGLGERLMAHSFACLRQVGLRRVFITFEPLEARNAHLYLNRWGGRCQRYHREHYHMRAALHQGLPIDRFILRFDLDREPQPRPDEPLAELLARLPLATPAHMPQADQVLVEITPDLQALKAKDMAAALECRLATRTVLEEYLNQRGLTATWLHAGELDGRQRAFYLLERLADEAQVDAAGAFGVCQNWSMC